MLRDALSKKGLVLKREASMKVGEALREEGGAACPGLGWEKSPPPSTHIHDAVGHKPSECSLMFYRMFLRT